MVSNVVITLLRHGRTLDNEKSRYSGWIDSKLSKLGQAEINEIKHFYGNTFSNNIDKIYTSDLKRTIETANLLFQNKYPMCQLKGLREMHFGDFEGKTYDNLKDNQAYQTWLNNLYTYELPNGESFNQFTKRIDESFNDIKKEIINNRFKHVVLVVHGGVIRHLLMNLTDDTRTFFDWQVPFAKGYQLKGTYTMLKEEKPCMSLQVVPTMENGNS